MEENLSTHTTQLSFANNTQYFAPTMEAFIYSSFPNLTYQSFLDAIPWPIIPFIIEWWRIVFVAALISTLIGVAVTIVPNLLRHGWELNKSAQTVERWRLKLDDLSHKVEGEHKAELDKLSNRLKNDKAQLDDLSTRLEGDEAELNKLGNEVNRCHERINDAREVDVDEKTTMLGSINHTLLGQDQLHQEVEQIKVKMDGGTMNRLDESRCFRNTNDRPK